jgi:hypothetical protein
MQSKSCLPKAKARSTRILYFIRPQRGSSREGTQRKDKDQLNGEGVCGLHKAQQLISWCDDIDLGENLSESSTRKSYVLLEVVFKVVVNICFPSIGKADIRIAISSLPLTHGSSGLFTMARGLLDSVLPNTSRKTTSVHSTYPAQFLCTVVFEIDPWKVKTQECYTLGTLGLFYVIPARPGLELGRLNCAEYPHKPPQATVLFEKATK